MSLNITTPDGTIITDPDQCTLTTCPLELANFHYVPVLGGNVLFTAIFGLLLLPQLYFGIKHKTWGYMIGMAVGLGLETAGYVARVMLHYNPFPFNSFLLYLVCLTIGPAFLSAAIYLCLGRIIVIYGPQVSRLKPRTYTIVFIASDFISLVLQGAGGGVAATAADGDRKTADMGINIMIAGLVSQVVSMTVFMVLCADFAWAVRRNGHKLNAEFEGVRASRLWKSFIGGLVVATVAIYVRSIFRVAELQQGFDGELANNEVLFMVLEGAMISIAGICLTVFHPGVCFRGNYDRGNFSFRSKKGSQAEYEMPKLNDSGESTA